MKLLALALATSLLSASAYNRSDWVNSSQWRKTREKILSRDQVNGHWVCKYSGAVIEDRRKVDIDHVIPLKYANEHGGDQFSPDKKHRFANDDSNLVSASAHENRSKGDDGLSQYLPAKNTCWYFRHWDYMSRKYGVKLTSADARILAKGLASCQTR